MSEPHDPEDALAAALAKVTRLNAEAADLAAAEPGSAVMPAADPGLPAEQVKEAMVATRHQAAAKLAELRAAEQQARGLIEAQRRALAERLVAMSDALDPLKRQLARMEEGIQAVNLYLGVGEELVTLADGDPVPAGTPICVWQTVLAMDEESAIAAEHGGIDHMGVDQFDEWITADPARVEQLIPVPRGVVAIMPRRAAKDYGDTWANAARNELNHATYFLIRNGGCLYRYTAPGFNAGRRLTPARDEFTALFTARRYNFGTGEYDIIHLEPGTREWDRAERAAGAVQRHYMKVALILQGLIDRTAAFHPLPAPGLSLLHQDAYDAGHIVLIADDEYALTAGRFPFRQWLAGLNAQLRPGMRIAGNFRCEAWRAADHSYERSPWRHSRLWPRTASHPVTGQVYTIERRDGGALVFLYERTDQVYRRDVPVPDEPGWVYRGLSPVPAQQRASARIYPEDTFIIPVDLVTIAECEAYLASRVDRHEYADMFPVLKAVIAAKRAEAEAEQPMRQLLAARIVADHGADFAEAIEAVPALVDWWKLANRWHRPLVTTSDPATEARALAAISREFAARRAAVTDSTEPEITRRIREFVPGVMLVARKRDGSWAALEPQPRTIDGEPGNVWAREHTWTKTLAGHRVRDWQLPEPSQLARRRILWTSEAWDARDAAATAAGYLTDPEIAAILATARQIAAEQATAPYQEYRNATPGPALRGRALAAVHHLSRDATDHRFTLWWLPAAPGDPVKGVTGAHLTITWRRTTGGKIATSHGQLRTETWTSVPWHPRKDLTWADADTITELQQALETYEAAREQRSALLATAGRLCQAIASQWSAAAREQARVKFIADYGDESLWEEHAKSLRFDCPHTGPHGWQKPWEKAVQRLVLAGADLARLTVAEMAAAHAALFGEAVEIPQDIAEYRFPAPGQGL